MPFNTVHFITKYFNTVISGVFPMERSVIYFCSWEWLLGKHHGPVLGPLFCSVVKAGWESFLVISDQPQILSVCTGIQNQKVFLTPTSKVRRRVFIALFPFSLIMFLFVIPAHSVSTSAFVAALPYIGCWYWLIEKQNRHQIVHFLTWCKRPHYFIRPVFLVGILNSVYF